MEASFPSIPLQPSTTIYNQHPIILSSDLLDLLGGKKPAAQNPSWLNRKSDRWQDAFGHGSTGNQWHMAMTATRSVKSQPWRICDELYLGLIWSVVNPIHKPQQGDVKIIGFTKRDWLFTFFTLFTWRNCTKGPALAHQRVSQSCCALFHQIKQ